MKTSFISQNQQECSNCRFYSPVVRMKVTNWTGFCRRYAPRPDLVKPGIELRTWFPETEGDEWCGEWEQREGAS